MTLPRLPRTLLSLALASLLVASACSSAGETADDAAPPTTTPPSTTVVEPEAAPAPVGLLDPGPATHLGTTWFSPPLVESSDLVFERWDEALEALESQRRSAAG